MELDHIMSGLRVVLTVTFVLVGAVSTNPTYADDAPCTRISPGVVCGELAQSREGRTYTAFRGIPYAEPPVGELRFKEPVPVEDWSTKYDATKDAPSCSQKNYLIADPFIEGQEDCLYINVYVPKIIQANDVPRHNLPVMVYVHGGGWFSGAGNSSLHGPEYFMDQDIVLVTFNYRLGVFGFLSTSDDVAPGNWALKDQTLALKWVQNNIKYFGGNEQSVTIFGQSAGGASVHYLLLSPETKGLFHKAIAQSGTALNLFATPIDSLMIARAQAQFVGCNGNGTSAEIVECLREVDADSLIEGGEKFKFWGIDPLTIFIPSVEKKTDKNPNPFITDLPFNLISNGQFHHVPFILGAVANEGLLRAAAIISQSELRESLNAKWNDLGPQVFGLPLSVNASLIPNLWKNMTDFYLGGKTSIDYTDPSNVQGFVDLYGDRGFIYAIYQSALKHAKLGLQPIYLYKFDYAGRDSWSSIFAGNVDTQVNYVFNKSHCDDLNYLFRIPDFFPYPLQKDSADHEMSKKMIELWTTFAKEGKPCKHWAPVTADKFQYLDILNHSDMSMKTDFFSKRMKFWENQNIKENR